nr:zinc finger AN1 and C2H2 domain-containing stress-associated protein 16-like [Ipomoea batatas]
MKKPQKKRKCPVPRCKEVLTFSNTIKCRDCEVDHCLKHRFGPDHNCPGPKKPEPAFQFLGFLSRKEEPKKAAPAPSSSRWTTSLLNAATSGIAKLSNEFNQALQIGRWRRWRGPRPKQRKQTTGRAMPAMQPKILYGHSSCGSCAEGPRKERCHECVN